MWEHIAALKGGTTIVLTTHYLEEADALADRVAVIDTGKMIALGTPDELKGRVSGGHVTVIEARDLTDEAFTALCTALPRCARSVDGGVEIEADDVSLYDVQDVLRPRGVVGPVHVQEAGHARRRVLGSHRKADPPMRSKELARRNLLEVWRDPVALGLTIGLPVIMLIVLQGFGGVDAFFTATNLAPGIALFGFVMLMFSAAMTLSRDRESALFSRLLTTPLHSNDFADGLLLAVSGCGRRASDRALRHRRAVWPRDQRQRGAGRADPADHGDPIHRLWHDHGLAVHVQTGAVRVHGHPPLDHLRRSMDGPERHWRRFPNRGRRVPVRPRHLRHSRCHGRRCRLRRHRRRPHMGGRLHRGDRRPGRAVIQAQDVGVGPVALRA